MQADHWDQLPQSQFYRLFYVVNGNIRAAKLWTPSSRPKLDTDSLIISYRSSTKGLHSPRTVRPGMTSRGRVYPNFPSISGGQSETTCSRPHGPRQPPTWVAMHGRRITLRRGGKPYVATNLNSEFNLHSGMYKHKPDCSFPDLPPGSAYSWVFVTGGSRFKGPGKRKSLSGVQGHSPGVGLGTKPPEAKFKFYIYEA